jgi:hypothetical protein
MMVQMGWTNPSRIWKFSILLCTCHPSEHAVAIYIMDQKVGASYLDANGRAVIQIVGPGYGRSSA